MYQPVIGLEVHLQPKTKSKMFCSCDAKYFGDAPNTHTCPVCLGLPGAIPVPNKKAIELCIKLGLALNCEIAKESKFDRKNYFYPDLPKGYQISQYDQPIATKGYLEADVNGDAKRFRITRVHMEEDTGKSMHLKDKTLLDFNKSGVPLIEIVTEPDFTSKEEVTAFAKRLRQIVRYCEVSDADMEKGQMRYELNISVKNIQKSETTNTKTEILKSKPEMNSNSEIPKSQTINIGKLPNYKVEVKNIGSISVLEKVIDFEIKRQSKILEAGDLPAQETRGLKDMSGETLSQRTKEDSKDYRYFPEPDIPPLVFADTQIGQIRQSLPELPQAKKWRYVSDYGIDPDIAETLVTFRSLYTFFEDALKLENDKEIIAEFSKWLVGDLRRLAKKHSVKLSESKMSAEMLLELVKLLKSGEVSGTIAKEVLTESFNSGKSPAEIIKEKDLSVISDSGELEKIIQEVIDENPKIVDDYKNKNENAIKFLLGQVMRKTKGQADPILAKQLLEKVLK